MYKLLFKSIAFTIILIAIFSYGVYLKTGKWVGPRPDKFTMPDMKMPDIKAPDIKLPKASIEGKKQVYKWQDEKGVWHYDTKKPPQKGAEQLVH